MSDSPNTIHSLLDFSGKTALVTGVLDDNSIAWPIAKYLNDAGARIAISIQRKAIKRLMGTILNQLRDPLLVECDVSQDEAIPKMVEEVGAAFGRVDFLIHSIAYAPPQSFQTRFLDIARQDFAVALDVSAYSLIALARGVFPLMREHGGCMLALSYLAAERVVPGYQLMSVAKAALENIIRNLAFDLAPYGIRVNGLSPGPIATKAATSIPGFSIMHEHFRAFAPLQKEVTTTDVGRTALFLCSPMAENITGEIIHIDGGFNIMGMTIKPPEGMDVR